MKCFVDFYKIEEVMMGSAIEYLKGAIEAHGGSFSFIDENGDFRNDINTPVVAANLDLGPADYNIRSRVIDKGWLSCEAEDNDCGCIVGLNLTDIVSAYHIQCIIESLPEPTKN